MTQAVCAAKCCGRELHRIRVSDTEWGWADADGGATHSRYPFNPYERLNDLAAVSPKSPQYVRSMAEYSRLVVDVDMGGWYQMHIPSRQAPEPRADQPDHCNWPAYLAPKGWQCRVCKEWL